MVVVVMVVVVVVATTTDRLVNKVSEDFCGGWIDKVGLISAG